MAIDLAAWWNQTVKDAEGTITDKLASWTREGIDAGLAAVSGAIGGGGTSSTPTAPQSLWDKLKDAFKKGTAESDLGKAATLSALMKNPVVIIGGALLGALVLRKVLK